MSAALTVQPRHLALPDACLVTPSQLSIPRSISKEEFLAVAAKLKALGQAEDFWLADAASFAKKWDDGLQLMAETVGRTKYHLVRVAQIAERFTPAKRFSYTVAHLRALMPFPNEFLDSFLPPAANLNLSVKALRARAETEFGSNPYKPQQPKKRSVPLRASLVAQLSERAPRKVSALVERICDEWLSKSPEQQASVLAGEELQKEQKKQKAKEPEAPGTADVRYQLKLYEAAQKAAREAQKAPVPANPTAGSDIPSAQPCPNPEPRPDYATRREQQLAEGAKPIPAKERKYTSKVKIVFTECRGNSFIESQQGQMSKFSAAARADRFFSLEKAEAAATEYSADRRYTVFAALCENCSAARGSKKVWHVFRERPSSADHPGASIPSIHIE